MIATTDNTHTATAAKTKDGTAGHAQHDRKAARARLGTNLLIVSCGKTARLIYGPKKTNLLLNLVVIKVRSDLVIEDEGSSRLYSEGGM